jgi:hypothetical protein
MKTIKIYFQNWNKASNEGYVWVSFYINREKINFSTKVRCCEKDFDKKYFRIKASDKLYSDKNIIIDNILARINSVFVKYRLRNKTLTRESFLRAYNSPDDYPNFFEFIKDWQKKYSYLQRYIYIKEELFLKNITGHWNSFYSCVFPPYISEMPKI